MAARRRQLALVLEDEALIALELEEMLRSAGIEDVVIMADCQAAIEFLTTATPDLAIVDYKLRGSHCGPVAKILTANTVPSIVYSGHRYDPEFHGADFGHFEWVQKPSDDQAIMDAFSRIGFEFTAAGSKP